MAAEQSMQQEMKRQERDTKLKKKLKDSNFGGRQMPLEDYKKIKHRVEQEEQEKQKNDNSPEFTHAVVDIGGNVKSICQPAAMSTRRIWRLRAMKKSRLTA